MRTDRAFKLIRLRKNGTLGPLFINRKQVIPVGLWMQAQAIKTKGFAFRPGWHCCAKPLAPHLSKSGRVWCEVLIQGITEHQRPESQGGLWYTAKRMKVVRIMDGRDQMLDCSEMSWEQMSGIVHSIWKEMKRRNPIGINMYAPAVKYASDLLDEIAEAEAEHATSEAGPKA